MYFLYNIRHTNNGVDRWKLQTMTGPINLILAQCVLFQIAETNQLVNVLGA